MTTFTFPELGTDRLDLVEPRMSHAQDIAEYMRDGRVQQHLPNIPDPYTEDDAEQYIEQKHEEMSPDNLLFWSLHHREDERVIGLANIHGIDTSNRNGELGYGLNPDYWGKGLMTEALQSIITYGFNAHNLYRIEAKTAERNTNSKNLLERLGFTKEGTLRDHMEIRGGRVDNAVYSMLRAEWDRDE
jgi:ribosomal-protein-alanine N-acetyltransferase